MSVNKRTKRVGPIVAAAVGLVLLAGCTSDSGSEASASPSESVPSGSASTAPEGERQVVTLRTAVVGDPGNQGVGVFTLFGEKGDFVNQEGGGIVESCDTAPPGPTRCLPTGSVAYEYGIGELEITVEQYVAFLNTVDPRGENQRQLYIDYMSPVVWPKYGSVAFDASAADGQHFSVAAPEWKDKPFGFADFLRSARFVNSLFNGEVLSSSASTEDGFNYVTYEVRLSPETEKGMYDMSKPDTTRTAETGFVIPSYDEWMKAAYYDPAGGGTFSYWTYPTGPSDAPNVAKLDRRTGDVINASDQPLAVYNPSFPKLRPGTFSTWCPPAAQTSSTCASANPINLPPGLSYKEWQGNLGTVGQALTPSPWGTKDMAGNVVEWQDTIVEPPADYDGKLPDVRVWRHMHGGVANAPVYQQAIEAIGFQPQDQLLLDSVYPWFGIRIGVVGDIAP